MSDPTPTARARLLEVQGNLCLSIDPAKIVPSPEPLQLPDVAELVGEDGYPRLPDGIAPEVATSQMIDVKDGMRAWLALAQDLPATPLFPVESLSNMLELLAPILVTQPGWRELTDAVDASLANSHGAATAAQRSYRRAGRLLGSGQLIEAIAEIHQAKLSWWSGDHLRPSLRMLLLLSECYSQLCLPLAAKQHALAAAHVALVAGDDQLVDVAPHALVRASVHEYRAGSWCSAVLLARLGIMAQQLTDESVDQWAQKDGEDVALTFGMTLRSSRVLFGADASLSRRLGEIIDEVGMLEELEAAMEGTDEWTTEEWIERCEQQLLGGPFEDTGKQRVIRFAGLGLRFTVRAANQWEHVLAAERLAAAAQVLLVELASFDLCLLDTEIELQVSPADAQQKGEVRSVPSNDGRRWAITLTPYMPGNAMNVDAVALELLTVLSQVLLDVSLLPAEDFMAAVEKAFEAGLHHKLIAARPYDELAAVIEREQFERLAPRSVAPPAPSAERVSRQSPLLAWQDGPGPTMTQQQRMELIAGRYERLPELMRRTLPRLRADRRFKTTVEILRKRGWKDWHILSAAYNILLQRRLAHAGLDIAGAVSSEAGMRAVRELAIAPEDEQEPEAPLGIFLNVEDMREALRTAMASVLANLNLELHCNVPDLAATERLLTARYGYWSDDVDHVEPFNEH